MASTELGYDAINDKSDVYESPEVLEQLKVSLGQMWEVAKQTGATNVQTRDIERVELVDGGSNGYERHDPIQRHIGIEQPKLEVSQWRTYTDREAGMAYHWSISRPVDDPNASPMLTLETPMDMGPWNLDSMKVTAIGIGASLEKRRIQDYVVGEDGKLHGRSADYTMLTAPEMTQPPTYRIVDHSQKSWEATENEVAFICDNLSRAELAGKDSDSEVVTAKDVAPNFPSA